MLVRGLFRWHSFSQAQEQAENKEEGGDVGGLRKGV